MDQLAGMGLEDFVRRIGADTERMLDAIMRSAKASPWASFQRPGDIVLTRGRRPFSHLNVAVQSLLEGSIARATHAMMVLAPGFYVDASVRFGVSILPASLFCIDGAAERRAMEQGPLRRRRLAAAFRHPLISGSAEQERALARVVAAQLGQPYNRRFIFKWVTAPERDRSAFCSELVARTLARLGLPVVPDRRFAAVLPHTLLRHLELQGWQDVSSSYRDGLPKMLAA